MSGLEEANEKHRVVGIAEMIVSDDPEDVLVTYSLGSCIGVAAWDSEARVGGLVHCLLPSAKHASREEGDSPSRFVDTGVVALLDELFSRGARRESLKVKIAGGGSPLSGCGSFRIGERNHAILRKVLWKNRLLVAAERIGGSDPKTLSLRVSDGRSCVRSGGIDEEI